MKTYCILVLSIWFAAVVAQGIFSQPGEIIPDEDKINPETDSAEEVFRKMVKRMNPMDQCKSDEPLTPEEIANVRNKIIGIGSPLGIKILSEQVIPPSEEKSPDSDVPVIPVAPELCPRKKAAIENPEKV